MAQLDFEAGGDRLAIVDSHGPQVGVPEEAGLGVVTSLEKARMPSFAGHEVFFDSDQGLARWDRGAASLIGVDGFPIAEREWRVSADGEQLAIWSKDRLRVVASGAVLVESGLEAPVCASSCDVAGFWFLLCSGKVMGVDRKGALTHPPLDFGPAYGWERSLWIAGGTGRVNISA